MNARAVTPAVAAVAFCASLAIGCAWLDGIDDPVLRATDASAGAVDAERPMVDGASDAPVDGGSYPVPPADAAVDATEAACAPAASGTCRVLHHDCTGGQGCLVTDPSGSPTGTTCTALGTAQQGDPCSGPAACAENLACLPWGDASVCGYWCVVPDASLPSTLDTCGLDLGAPGQGGCPSGTQCLHDIVAADWLGECVR